MLPTMTGLIDPERFDWTLLPLLMLLSGVFALAWAIRVAGIDCDPDSFGYEDCIKTAAVTSEVGLLGGILIIASVLIYWAGMRTRRRRLSKTPPSRLNGS
jgi:hypothetical protein